MESPIPKPPGTPALDIDTPSLVLDLDAFEHNLSVAHAWFVGQGSRLRPQVHVHKTPEIARRQLAVAGAAQGVAVVSVGEAEVFADAGISDIFLSYPLVTESKIARACALAKRARLTLTVETADAVQRLSRAAASAGVVVDVAVDVQTAPDRPGVAPGNAAVVLARQAAVSPSLRFAGFSSAGSPLVNGDIEALRFRDWTAVQVLADTSRMAEGAGLDVPGLSFGDSANIYDVIGKADGITEVRTGIYPFLDGNTNGNTLPYGPSLKCSVRVLATVSSRPEPGRAILDAGQKSVAKDFGLPTVDGREDLTVVGMNAEHTTVDSSTGGAVDLRIGEKVWLIPADVSTAFALHDVVYAVRGGVVEDVWEIAARGMFA
ncbi:MAG: alanine racemase [Dehalococcoidia bacterium]